MDCPVDQEKEKMKAVLEAEAARDNIAVEVSRYNDDTFQVRGVQMPEEKEVIRELFSRTDNFEKYLADLQQAIDEATQAAGLEGGASLETMRDYRSGVNAE